MKINVLDRDPRQYSEPEIYKTNMGSFGIVADLFNRGLQEIGCYAEKDNADFVGTCDALDFSFKYKNKRPFLIHVWDQINTIPLELRAMQRHYDMKMVGLSNQVSNLWNKYGVECKTAMPGCDTSFYKPIFDNYDERPFTFLFESFANVRSGLDLALQAYWQAFGDSKETLLIVKNTVANDTLNSKIQSFIDKGASIDYISERMSSEQMRYLYNISHVSLHVYRHSSWGLGVHQAAACNSIPIVGDFCPSNEMAVGLKLKPSKEVLIKEKLPELVNEWGLHNAYGNFTYDEEPLFYDYNIEEYAALLKDIYNNYNQYVGGLNLRKNVVDYFSIKQSAEQLVEALS